MILCLYVVLAYSYGALRRMTVSYAGIYHGVTWERCTSYFRIPGERSSFLMRMMGLSLVYVS